MNEQLANPPDALRRRVAVAAIAIAILLGGCSGRAESVAEPVGEPYVRGPIESISHRATATGIVVQPSPGSDVACGISARVDAETRYLRRDAEGQLHLIAVADLEVGDTVEVFVTGPIAESCPVQGYASTMVLDP